VHDYSAALVFNKSKGLSEGINGCILNIQKKQNGKKERKKMNQVKCLQLKIFVAK
jgi:hypothetical protein